MRISDWSSDVCSSDLPTDQAADFPVRHVGKSATNSSFRGANDARVQPAIRAASRLSVARAAVRPECWQQRSLRSCALCPRSRICRTLPPMRSEEHTSELQSLMRISYAVFCLKKKNKL